MRIISGEHKGRRITAPKKLPVRPTKDMAKEALFNILNNRFYFNELDVLDLFAGTGNISYEFASRGAISIIAVDGNAGCISFIAKTAELLEMNISPIKSDAFSYLSKVTTKWDIIFADPPYDIPLEEFEAIPKHIFEKKLLNDDGILIIEHSDKTDLSVLSNHSNSRKYGGSVFSFFEYKSEV